MDPRQDHEDWDALAVGWAMSALDREDEERFAEHLPGCVRCTATVRESLYTVADLAYALPDEAPPASLKSRLMAAVAAEPRRTPAAPEQPSTGPEAEWPQLATPAGNLDWFARPSPDASPGDTPVPPVVGDPAGNGATPEPDRLTAADRPVVGERPGIGDPADRPVVGERPGIGEPADRPVGDDRPAEAARPSIAGRDARSGEHPEPHDGEGVVVPIERRRRSRRITVAAAAAAVLALIAGLGVWNVQLRSDQDSLRRLVAQRDEAIQQLTASGPARVAALTVNGQPSPQRRATLVVRGNQIEIIVETLGPTTDNQRYWLWTLRCDTPTPTDLKPIRGFTVTQPAFSVRDIGSDPGVATATCFAISSELGSATPTTPRQVVAVGQPE
jgi:hypothetical protein